MIRAIAFSKPVIERAIGCYHCNNGNPLAGIERIGELWEGAIALYCNNGNPLAGIERSLSCPKFCAWDAALQ